MKLYDWNQLNEEAVAALITRTAIHGDQLTVARVKLQKNAAVPEHSHRHEQITMVESGALKYVLGGREYVLRAGDTMVIAAHEPHSGEALEDTAIVDIFSPAREDWPR